MNRQQALTRLAFSVLLMTLICLARQSAYAHNGRGFEIEVVAGKLQAQGFNSAAPDGAPAIRPYLNSIHDHWRYIQQIDESVATLPEFEVSPQVAFSDLESYSLAAELVSATQWKSPPLMPMAGTIPSLTPLDVNEVISIQTLGAPVLTDTLGTLELSSSVPAGGTGDIIPSYSVSGSPRGKIHVLELVLSANAPDATFPGIASSDPIFVLLSPDGVGPVERLHHASLYLERYLGENGRPVPEPGTTVLLLTSLLMVVSCRRSSQ